MTVLLVDKVHKKEPQHTFVLMTVSHNHPYNVAVVWQIPHYLLLLCRDAWLCEMEPITLWLGASFKISFK